MVCRALVFAVALTVTTSCLSLWNVHAFSSGHHRAASSTVSSGIPTNPIKLHRGSSTSGMKRGGNFRDVSLQMGIRSFIKRKILRREEGGSDDQIQDPESSAPEDVTLRSVLQSPNSSGLMESPVTKAPYGSEVDTKKKERDSSSGRKRNKAVDDILTNDMKQRLQEDAKHRIQRVQAGGMTEEEKLSFLNTALTRTQPPKKPRGPPIRQKIPGLEDEDSGSGSSDRKNSSSDKDGSSKTDNLWSAITGKGGASSASAGKSEYVPVSSLILDGKLRNEEAKRQWIDSITNPDRFASFTSIQGEKAQAEAVSVDENMVAEEEDKKEESDVVSEQAEADASMGEQDFTQMKRKMIEDQEILLKKPKVEKPGEKSVREALESILAMTGNKNVSSSNTTVSKNNDLAARLEKAASEQEKRDAEARIAAEKKRAEEKQALIEAQKEREAKFLRQEAERMEEARKKAEQMRLDEEAKKEAERAKVEAAVAKQEEYWANQLKKQQAKREASMSAQERRAMEQQKIVQDRNIDEMLERDIAKDVKREQIKEEERLREPEHESEILKEAEEKKLHDREFTRDAIDQSAARVSRTVAKPSKGDASVSAFVEEQRRKKAEIDKLAEIQQQRLKMLNSPLTPQKKPPVRMTVPVPPSPAPRPAPAVSPELSLSSLTMKKGAPAESSTTKVASPTPSPPDLSIASLTMKKNAQQSPAVASSAPKRPAKKAVRQQLPITTQFDDDDDEDDDNLMRKGGAGLTVADALKQQKKDGGGNSSGKNMDADSRAKQWGIDMSKFK